MTAADAVRPEVRGSECQDGGLRREAGLLWRTSAAGLDAWGQTVGEAASTLDAAIKSATIYGRGVRALQDSCRRVFMLSLADAALMARGLATRTTLDEAVRLELDLAPLLASRAAGRGMMISNMAVQVLEEAAYPMVRRAGAALEHAAATTMA